MRRLTLLVNADDTLWESNVFFEHTLERFFSLVEPFGYARAYAWLIGSSAQQEINPALQAGLNAAFVPHAASWNNENAELQSGAGKLLIVSSFRGLRDHF